MATVEILLPHVSYCVRIPAVAATDLPKIGLSVEEDLLAVS